MIARTVDGAIVVNSRHVRSACLNGTRDVVLVLFMGEDEDTPFAFHTREAAKAFLTELSTAIGNAEDAAEDLSDVLGKITDTLAGIKSAIELRNG
jgi:hypothetical protein